jgi:hypothetical protein
MKPANLGLKAAAGHTIRVPAKYARHARHYIEGYMKGYLGHFDKREAAQAREAKKVTHVAAEYKEHGTAARHCAVCSMYEGPNKCSAVKSPISPAAVCKLFEKRESRVEKRLRKGV